MVVVVVVVVVLVLLCLLCAVAVPTAISNTDTQVSVGETSKVMLILVPGVRAWQCAGQRTYLLHRQHFNNFNARAAMALA